MSNVTASVISSFIRNLMKKKAKYMPRMVYNRTDETFVYTDVNGTEHEIEPHEGIDSTKNKEVASALHLWVSDCLRDDISGLLEGFNNVGQV